MTFQSPQTLLRAPAKEVYSFLSNLNNLEKLMPEQVINWKSDEKSCSFDIRGMAHIHLILGERIENKLVTIDSGPDNPIEVQIVFNLEEKAEETCGCTVALQAELSMMLELLASQPLQNLVNIMAGKLREVFPD